MTGIVIILRDILLLDNGANLRSGCTHEDSHGRSAVYDAASFGETTILKLFSNSEVDLEAPTWEGYTALNYAILKRQKESVKLILGLGASVNTVTKKCKSLLHFAVLEGLLS